MTADNSYVIYYLSTVEQFDAEWSELFFVKSDQKCGRFSEL